MSSESSKSSSRAGLWWRVLLAGPVAILTSAAVVFGSALWLPGGAAQINHLVLPLILFPAIWAALFFHACLHRRLGRAYAIQCTLLAANMALITTQLT